MTRPARRPKLLGALVDALVVAAMVVGPVRLAAQAQPQRGRARPGGSTDAYDPNRPSPAGEPYFRTFSGQSGMTDAPVHALAQDSAGFLWVGGVSGLFRYDGRTFRHWMRDSISTIVSSIAVSPAGEVVVGTAVPAVFRITSNGVEPLPAPPGGWRELKLSVAFDGSGHLWAADGRLLRFDSATGWRRVSSPVLRSDSAEFIRGGADRDGVYVVTAHGVWQATSDGTVRQVWRGSKVVDVARGATAGLLILQFSGRVVGVRGGIAREVLPGDATPYGRAIAVTERHGTVWVAFDRYLAAVRPGEPPDVFGPEDGLESGGPLLVDREGSLWLGTFESLVQYPEPRTKRWSYPEGLPSQHTRYIARTGRDIAVVTWQGLGLLTPRGTGWRASSTPLRGQNAPCALADGSLLLSEPTSWVRLGGTTLRATPADWRGTLHECAPAADGGRWLATSSGLLHLTSAHAPPGREGSATGHLLHWVASPFTGVARVEHVAVDSSARLWVSVLDSVCSTPEIQLIHDTAAAWSCARLPGGGVQITSLLALPGGSLWASSTRARVLRFSHGRWEAVPGAKSLPSPSVLRLVPSRSGGVWVVGHGFVWRVLPRPDLPAGWQVVETLSGWHGVAPQGISDLLEDADGGVWLASDEGVVHVPSAVRRLRATAPPVVVVEARADGRSLPLGPAIVLSHGHNRLELHFSALSFRDPASLRYEVRLSPHDAWAPVRGAPVFQWLGLAPGTYEAQVRASLDGTHWSATPAALRFRVEPPWYLEPQMVALEIVILLVLLAAAYRLRVAYLLRLEQQRTRIAMDLHDEVGSGLASVAILSGVLAGDRMTATEARSAAGDIARTAEELGDSLADIVWSLQSGKVSLETLAARLAEQGAHLFADGETRFQTRLPVAYPDVAVDLSLLRTVLLVGLEALHNASKYAQATEVMLALRPEGDFWVLEIADDGVGMSPDDLARARGITAALGGGGRHGGGHGLPGMRRRAEESGATLTIDSAPGAGTTVRLRFELNRPSWRARVARRFRRRARSTT